MFCDGLKTGFMVGSGVVLNRQYSDWKWVLSGVLQGPVLGPFLFVVVYINDIDEQIVSKILKFADDTKIYHIVQSPKDIETLQSDLRRLVEWSKDWQMLFNTDKCKVLNFGFNNPHIDYSMD